MIYGKSTKKMAIKNIKSTLEFKYKKLKSEIEKISF